MSCIHNFRFTEKIIKIWLKYAFGCWLVWLCFCWPAWCLFSFCLMHQDCCIPSWLPQSFSRQCHSSMSFLFCLGLNANISPCLHYQEQSQHFPCYSVDGTHLFTYFPILITFVYLESTDLIPLCQVSTLSLWLCCQVQMCYFLWFFLSNSVGISFLY